MPHAFSNRRRILNLTADKKALRAQFRWETINAIAYKLGGVLFVIGSFSFSRVELNMPISVVGYSLLPR